MSDLPAGRRPMPHVSVATFCERVLQEKDGVYSVIRIIDSISLPPSPPENAILELTALVLLKSDEARGKYELSFVRHPPAGAPVPLGEPVPIVLNGDEHGASLTVYMPTPIGVLRPGLYWFDVLLDGVRLTRIPLRLRQDEAKEPSRHSTK